jgi:hypothetical protein
MGAYDLGRKEQKRLRRLARLSPNNALHATCEDARA